MCQTHGGLRAFALAVCSVCEVLPHDLHLAGSFWSIWNCYLLKEVLPSHPMKYCSPPLQSLFITPYCSTAFVKVDPFKNYPGYLFLCLMTGSTGQM